MQVPDCWVHNTYCNEQSVAWSTQHLPSSGDGRPPHTCTVGTSLTSWGRLFQCRTVRGNKDWIVLLFSVEWNQISIWLCCPCWSCDGLDVVFHFEIYQRVVHLVQSYTVTVLVLSIIWNDFSALRKLTTKTCRTYSVYGTALQTATPHPKI